MSFGKTINLGNSIIGVSILAMPYCFAQSGVILSILLIILSGFLTRLSCYLLLKSAFLSRQTSFEMMVQNVLGMTGRLLVEISLIGFLLGTCVAYFIMIGDLAPKILTDLLDIKNDSNLRLITILSLSLFVALPLSLLKKIDSLTSLSVLSLILYSCLVLKLMIETTEKMKSDTLTQEKFVYWRISGLLNTLSIYTYALSCQTSLFEIFDSSVINCDLETLKRDNIIIKQAVYMCSFAYIITGLLGYMAFHDQNLYGNILLAFPPSLTTTLTKLLFTTSLLMSFPLCLFPCRTSVYSLTIGKMREFMKFRKINNLGRIDGSSSDCFKLVPHEMHDNEEMTHNPDDKNNNYNIKVTNQQNNSSNGKYYNNLTLPVFGKSSLSSHQPDQMQLHTIISNNGTSTYAYTKLLSDDEEFTRGQELEDRAISLDDNDTDELVAYHNPKKIYMSDFHFRLLTVILIITTVMLSLLFPHIEFILGIIGSTAGTTVCFILPAYTFIKIGKHSRIELLAARALLVFGLAMLVFCTYSTIHKAGAES